MLEIKLTLKKIIHSRLLQSKLLISAVSWYKAKKNDAIDHFFCQFNFAVEVSISLRE